MDDRELLREYVEGKSQEAFAQLVQRHVHLVYATALRLVRERTQPKMWRKTCSSISRAGHIRFIREMLCRAG